MAVDRWSHGVWTGGWASKRMARRCGAGVPSSMDGEANNAGTVDP